MRSLLLILKQELRVVFSDRKAVALLFIMPAFLIVCLSLAMKDIYLQKVGQNMTVTFLLEQSMLSDQIVEQFSGFSYGVKKQYDHVGIDKYIESNPDSVVIEFPESIGEVIKGRDSESRIKMYFDSSLDKSFTELVKSHLMIAMQSMVIDQVNKKLKEQGQTQVQINQLAMAKDIVQEVGRNQMIPNPIQQTVPGWALFAMFFIALPMSSSFIRDRNNGVFKRLLCFNVKKSQLLLGKIIPYVIITNIQFTLMLLLGVYLLPILMGSSITMGPMSWGVVAISLVCSLAATGYGLLVSSLAKSNEQASVVGALLVVIMALLGGIMIPSFVMPKFMQQIGAISPLYWGMESYLDLFLRGEALSEILPRLLVLLLFSIVAFIVSLNRFRWGD